MNETKRESNLKLLALTLATLGSLLGEKVWKEVRRVLIKLEHENVLW